MVQAREQLLFDSGLLLPREGQRAAFYHFSIQELLAVQRFLDVEPLSGALIPSALSASPAVTFFPAV